MEKSIERVTLYDPVMFFDSAERVREEKLRSAEAEGWMESGRLVCRSGTGTEDVEGRMRWMRWYAFVDCTYQLSARSNEYMVSLGGGEAHLHGDASLKVIAPQPYPLDCD